ncbi:MAG: hypothetical protein JWQ71_2530 [Pedosphaera sp.]|nr:hypothetical protein [Pedosphaera sp.]
MGLIVILPLAALAIFGIVSIHQWLRRGNYDAIWWRAFRISACCGLVLGLWFTLFLQYKVPNGRISGFPIPLRFSQKQTDDTWKESSVPAAIHYAVLITDILCGVAIGLVPLRVAGFLKENRKQHPHYPPPNP